MNKEKKKIYDALKFERNVWLLDQKINTTGLYFDKEAVEKAIGLIEDYKILKQEELKKITDSQVETPKQIDKMMNWLRANGCDIPGLTKEYVGEYLKKDLSDDVRKVLEIRKTASLASVAKMKAFIRMAGRDNRMRGHLLYHGAGTGRWTGRLAQFQNITRGIFKKIEYVETCIKLIKTCSIEEFMFYYSDPLTAISYCIRGMITASPGNILRCADFSSVEARCLAWAAGEKNVVKSFIDGLDLYVVAASGIYKIDYEKVTPAQRQIGKVAILALGYQGGAGAFNNMAKGYGVKLPDNEVKKIVEDYRKANPNIVKLWYNVDNAVKKCIRTEKRVTVAPCYFEYENDFLFMVLPSGRRLAYYKPEIGENRWGGESITYMAVNSFSRKWERIESYGGKFVENMIQAMSRDFMVYSMLNLDAAGFNIVLTVHDEIISDDPIGFKSLKEFIKIMKKPPLWAVGMPLDADGWEGFRYRKD